MRTETPKQRLYAACASVARALGHAHRLDMLEHIGQGERAVEALAERSGVSVANASQHLQQLRRAGLVVARRNGKFVLYRLSGDWVVAAVAALRMVAEQHLAEVQHTQDAMEPVSREELVARLRDHAATLLDVRPAGEYRAGHLPGALNVALDDLESRLAELPLDREIVAYCRGPDCVLAFEAVRVLRARGYRVRRLEDGFPEWKAAGLPVEVARAA